MVAPSHGGVNRDGWGAGRPCPHDSGRPHALRSALGSQSLNEPSDNLLMECELLPPTASGRLAELAWLTEGRDAIGAPAKYVRVTYPMPIEPTQAKERAKARLAARPQSTITQGVAAR